MNAPRQSHAFWITKKGEAAILPCELGGVPNGHSLVKVIASGVSPGTENLVFSGQVPELVHEEMKVPYMEGSFNFPIKYGYSAAGEVISSDEPALLGKRVHLLHPHQEVIVASNNDLFVYDDNIPAPRATLASNLETAVNAVWDSQVTLGQRCLIVGFGIIGSLVARVLSKLPEVEVVVVDSNLEKVELAARLGFEATTPRNFDKDFDLAFHASSSSEGLQICVDSVGFEGKVIELSWYGSRQTTLNLGGDFHSKRKSIVASQVSTLPATMQRRWSYRRRKETVFGLLRDAVFDKHITESVKFRDLPEYYNSGGLKKPGLARVVDYST